MVIRHIDHHHRISSDIHIVTNGDLSQYLGASSDVDVITDLRSAWLVNSFKSDGDTVSNNAVVTKTGESADYDFTKMVDAKTPAHRRLAGKFYAGQYLNYLVQKLVEQGKRLSGQPVIDGIAPAAKTVDQHYP